MTIPCAALYFSSRKRRLRIVFRKGYAMPEFGGKKLKAMLNRQADKRGLKKRKSDHPIACDSNFTYKGFSDIDDAMLSVIASSGIAKPKTGAASRTAVAPGTGRVAACARKAAAKKPAAKKASPRH